MPGNGIVLNIDQHKAVSFEAALFLNGGKSFETIYY